MQISRKECEKFKMAINFDYDFSGWATKANVKCFDGLTIAPNAFKECDGQVVPVVWNHDHSSPDNVLGHALLQNRKEGVYAYVKLNNTSSGQTAKACVDNGDIDAMSIFANGVQKAGRTVMHGMIKELSLVIAGCNPGALIDEVVKHSADGTEMDSSEAYIYTDSGLSLKHGLDPDDNPLEDETLQHSDDSSETDKDEKGESKMADANEKTVKDVFDTLTEEQKNVVYAIIGSTLDEGNGGESDDKGDGEEDNTMHHCFENDNSGTVLKHSLDDINGIIATASKHGTLRDAFLDAGITGDELAHSIENMDYLFPDDHNLDTVPRIVDRDQTWVDKVMNSVHHVPFARVKVMFADLTEDDARAKGYIKGNYKKEQVFKLLKRSTTPTTVYKKQRFDRDDIIDMSTMDVVAFTKKEQRGNMSYQLKRTTNAYDKYNEYVQAGTQNTDDGLAALHELQNERYSFIGYAEAFADALNMSDDAKKVTMQLGIAIADNWKSISNGFNKAWGKVQESYPAIAQKLSNFIGLYMRDGAAETITASMSAVVAAMNGIKGLGSWIVNGFKSIFGIHSPSTVMAELGAYMGQGFANGITSTEDGVNRSMDDMTSSALDIATNAAQMLYDVATGQGSAEPIFTPVLNLSDYASPTSWAATQAYTPSAETAERAYRSNELAQRIGGNQNGVLTKSQSDNSDVVNAIGQLGNRVDRMAESISKMKLVLDSGKTVGELAPKIDSNMGGRNILAERGVI